MTDKQQDWEQVAAGYRDAWMKAEAEIERLQFEVTDWQERNERLSVEAGRLSVQVDGLRAALADLVDATAPDSNMARVFAARKAAATLLASAKE